MEKSQSHIDKNPSEREKQKTGKLPNVTDIMEKSQSNIDKNPSEGGKTEKTEKKETFTIWHRSSSVIR
jgi:hypothetical protein